MVERVSDLPAGVLGFRASGKIARDEYAATMEPIYAALGELRLFEPGGIAQARARVAEPLPDAAGKAP